MNPHLWSWPQWIWIGIAVLSLVCHAAWHGEERSRRKWNFPLDLMSAAIAFGFFWWGGFFP